MIEPNSTDSRPRRSPSTPQSTPPTSMPSICMLMMRMPCSSSATTAWPPGDRAGLSLLIKNSDRATLDDAAIILAEALFIVSSSFGEDRRDAAIERLLDMHFDDLGDDQ